MEKADARIITLKHSELAEEDKDLSDQIEGAFGPLGLGIVAVEGVPGYPALRERLLLLAERLAALPKEATERLEDPDSLWNVGWSHGREALDDGRPDVHKASFYANPLVDLPNANAVATKRFPCYCRPNLWPDAELPELRPAFQELGRLIICTGLLLAGHCDRYAAARAAVGAEPKFDRRPGQPATALSRASESDPALSARLASEQARGEGVWTGAGGRVGYSQAGGGPEGDPRRGLGLQAVLARSPCPKGRLLHYYPLMGAACGGDAGNAGSVQGFGQQHAGGAGAASRDGCSMSAAATRGNGVPDGHPMAQPARSGSAQAGCGQHRAGDARASGKDECGACGGGGGEACGGDARGRAAAEGDWCGWHRDHGSLTGLTSALFTRGGEAAAAPGGRAGLHIRTRSGRVVRASFPPDHLAFQMGEAMQVQSGGLLQATPHCVRAASGLSAAGIARNAFAVFMQPRWDEPLEAPAGVTAEQVGVPRWRTGLTFGEFAELTVQGYYQPAAPAS